MYTISNGTTSNVSVDDIGLPPHSVLTPVDLTGDQIARFEAAGATVTWVADNDISDMSTRISAVEALTVTGSGLATGGGDLTADRVIDVAVASQAEAEALTADDKAMTPLKTAQAIAAYVAGLPVADPHVAGEAWLDAGVVTVSAG